MEQNIALLIPLAGIALIFGIVYLGVTSDNRKNLAMIEAGMNPNEKKGNKRRDLRTALLLIFIPIGLVLGNYISGKGMGDLLNSASITCAFLFGGLALLVFYYLDSKAKDKEIQS